MSTVNLVLSTVRSRKAATIKNAISDSQDYRMLQES